MADQTKRQQLESHLAARAVRDPEFRDRLLRDPKAAIEAEIGLRFPERLAVAVHEERMDQLHIVLPVDFLTDDELLSKGDTPGGTPFWKRP